MSIHACELELNFDNHPTPLLWGFFCSKIEARNSLFVVNYLVPFGDVKKLLFFNRL